MSEVQKLEKMIADFKAKRAQQRAKSQPTQQAPSIAKRREQASHKREANDFWRQFARDPAAVYAMMDDGKFANEWRQAMAGYEAANRRLEEKLARLAKSK